MPDNLKLNRPPGRLSGTALQYRTLGKTGLKVTTVGYGCMITSDPTVITRAVDMGINYFDTSRNYQGGQNERMVGVALGAKRKDIFLASKCDTRTGAGILAELDRSLTELGTDHLEVWHLHGLGDPAQISDELVAAQHKAKEQGKIRFMGVSTAQSAGDRGPGNRSQTRSRAGAIQLRFGCAATARPSRNCTRPAWA